MDSDMDNEDPVECCKCQGSNVEISLSKEERRKIQWQHTDKDGNWKEEELPEDERNEQFLVEMI